MRTTRKRWASILLVVCLCAIMATVGLMNISSLVSAGPTQYAGVTIANGKFVSFSALSGTPYGPGGKVTTNGSLDYDYQFMGYYKNPVTVGSAKAILVTGNFSMYDDYSGPWSARICYVYVLNSARSAILGQQAILAEYNGDVRGHWYQRTALITGLTQGTTVYVGFGRADMWSMETHHLTFTWGGVIVPPQVPSDPAFPHAYGGPAITIATGWNLVTLEYWNTYAVYANTMVTGSIDGCSYTDYGGNVHTYGPYYANYVNFELPWGSSFILHATSPMSKSLQNPTMLAHSFTQLLYPVSNNYVGGIVDYWYTYGIQNAPSHMMPPPPGPGGHHWVSYIGALITARGGGAYTGSYTISAFNTTTQSWMTYMSGYPATDFAIDTMPSSTHVGFQMWLSANGQIIWNVG